jgi:hypothetical protein
MVSILIRKKRKRPDDDKPNIVHFLDCAFMLRQAGVSTEVRAEMSGHSIETAMNYGRPKAREKERAAGVLPLRGRCRKRRLVPRGSPCGDDEGRPYKTGF